MSLLPADSIKTIAESIGIQGTSDDVAFTLAQDIEYRLRDIIQEALKFMRHSKRTKLTTVDINHALKVRNVERLYGFSSNAPVNFKLAGGGGSVGGNGGGDNNAGASIFYLDDDELDFDDIINAPMPKVPADVAFTAHWLAIEGVQPAIPQNPAPIETRIELLSRRLKAEGKFDLLEKKSEVKPLIRHILTKELQLFYSKITEALLSQSEDLRNTALESIREDHGIQQLLPYFIQFVTEEITKNLKNLRNVRTMLNVIEAVLRNPHFFVEPYLHQLMPPILTCLVAKRLTEDPNEDHWTTRNMASSLLSEICGKYGDSYDTLRPRVTRTLLRAFLDPMKALTTHYGAIVGLAGLGTTATKSLLISNMKPYVQIIKPVVEDSSNSVKQMEAKKCMDALKAASIAYLQSEATTVSRANTGQNMDVDLASFDFASIEGSPVIFEIFGDNLMSQ